MAAPSPIHRDPELDGNDYGCIGRRANQGNIAVAKLVEQTCDRLAADEFTDIDELAYQVQLALKQLNRHYGCGSCDTIVKENVFAALSKSISAAGLDDLDETHFYGW